MPVTFKIDTAGVTAKLKGVVSDTREIVIKELNRFGGDTVNEAKRRVPVNEGHLNQTISFEPATTKNLKVTVVVAADYAAYVEFGTKSFAAAYVATLPATWQAYAATFKGKSSGTFDDFIFRLMEWIRHKGLGSGFGGSVGVAGTYSTKTRKRTGSKKTQEDENRQAAYLIARKILRYGLRPQPFLYPAVQITYKQLLERIK